MARTPQDVTGAELEVLQALWDRGPCSRRQLAGILYPDAGPASYTTVQKLLERLEAKGHVAPQPGPGTRTFAAAVDRETLISRRLLDVAEQLCDGSLAPLLMCLVRARPLSAQELNDLRGLLEELKRQPPSGHKRR
jgi:predicted transcriptional regulator